VSAESLDLAIEDGRIAIDAHREKEPTDDYQYVEENRSLFLDIDLPSPMTPPTPTRQRRSIGASSS